jgi:putative ABC transport system substrate-binding protein
MSLHRRDFITLLGGAAAAWPVGARAQRAVPVIGFLGGESLDLYADRLRGFRQGLNEAGFTEGQNVAIEYRWAEGRNDRLPGLASELARLNVNVIVTGGGTGAAVAAKAASTTIPIVFQVGSDPVQLGLVASLSRPGGNATGVNSLNGELASKELELLHQLLPGVSKFAFLVNPTNPGVYFTAKDREEAASAMGLELYTLKASSPGEFDAVFANLAAQHVGGLVINADPFLQSQGAQLAGLALRYGVPAVGQLREFVVAGGAMSYGASIMDQLRWVGIYTGRILKGEKPSDLPVQQTTKIDLIVNLKTAKALGITVPLELLIRADELIE